MFRRLFVLALVPIITADAQQGTERLEFGTAMFAPEQGDTVEADTATLSVPKNRGSSSGYVTLPVVRFRSKGAAASPIIYLSGGSGSGIAAARGPRYPFFQSLREIGDVITFDLRGAGRSSPRIACKPGEPIPVGVSMSYASLSDLLRRNAATCAAELRAAGVDLDGHDMSQIVQDIESLRVALGAPKLRLIGTSTGSQIALEYLRRYPSRVERAVTLGVQAPDQMLHSPREQEKVIATLAARLRKPGDSSPDLMLMIRSVLDSLEARPRTVVVKPREQQDSVIVSLAKFDAQLLIAATLGDRRLLSLLPQLFGAAARGDYLPLAGFKLQAARGGITSPFESIADCQVAIVPARRVMISGESRSSILGQATLDFPESCEGWGIKPLPASYSAPVRSSVPVLLVSGTLDGRTPVKNAEETMRHLRNATHLVIDGASHGDLFMGTAAIGSTIRDFLSGKTLTRRIDISVDP